MSIVLLSIAMVTSKFITTLLCFMHRGGFPWDYPRLNFHPVHEFHKPKLFNNLAYEYSSKNVFNIN